MRDPITLYKWVHPDSYMGEEYPEYYIIYSRNRDSDILTESNFEVIKEELKDSPGVIIPSFSHWLCGWLEIIMVHEKEEKTLEKARALLERIREYPVLDEEDYSRRECELIDSYSEDIDSDIDNIREEVREGYITKEEGNERILKMYPHSKNLGGLKPLTIDTTKREIWDYASYHLER